MNTGIRRHRVALSSVPRVIERKGRGRHVVPTTPSEIRTGIRSQSLSLVLY